MSFTTRSLSPHESRVVLALAERGQREATRAEIVALLGVTPKAADHVISALRHKGWLERATWGKYLLVPPEQGPDALGDSNLLALASQVATPYYIGFGSAAAHYGLTTQYRNIIHVVTPASVRGRTLAGTRVRIVNQSQKKFFGFELVDILGYKVMMSDREKTAIDCVDRPELAGGFGEAAVILATASRRFDWTKAVDHLARIGSGALVRRIGWLTDHAQADVPPDARAHLLALAARSRSTWLGSDPARARKVADAVGFDNVWRVYVNATLRDLHESAGLGKRKTRPKGP